MSDQVQLEENIARLIADGATGVFEVRQDQKRWLLFFSGGALVYSKSNLKSEQVEAVRAKVGEQSESEINRLQAVRRLRNILRAEGTECSFHDEAHPPQVTPVDAIGVLIEAVKEAYDPELVRQRIGPLLDGFPRVTVDLGGLGIPPSLEAYLQDMDGGRPGRDVVEFAPAPPDLVQAALLVLWRLGDLDIGDERLDAMEVRGLPEIRSAGAAPRPAEAPAAPAPGAAAAVHDADDLGALIDHALAGAPTGGAVAVAEAEAARAHALAPRLGELRRRIEGADNHFQILDVPWHAEDEEIRKAYNAVARDLHPDRYHEATPELRNEATELFDRVRRAFEELSDPQKKSEYVRVAIHGEKSAEDLAREQLETYWAADDAFRKGLTLFKNGRLADAYAQFRIASEAAPEEIEFQTYYGYTRFAVNRQSDPRSAEEGLTGLREALERNKHQERHLDGGWALLGRAYREKGELDQARRSLVQALRINPANSDAVREMRRLEADQATAAKKDKKGFLAGLFSRK